MLLPHTSPDFSCALDVGVISGLNRSTCDTTYAFRHRLGFTSNATAFEVCRVGGREGGREGGGRGGVGGRERGMKGRSEVERK